MINDAIDVGSSPLDGIIIRLMLGCCCYLETLPFNFFSSWSNSWTNQPRFVCIAQFFLVVSRNKQRCFVLVWWLQWMNETTNILSWCGDDNAWMNEGRHTALLWCFQAADLAINLTWLVGLYSTVVISVVVFTLWWNEIVFFLDRWILISSGIVK